MKRIGLVVNPNIKDAVETSVKVIEYLKSRCDLTITKELHDLINANNKTLLEQILNVALEEFRTQDLELVIAIGGDGTILRTLHHCNIKIFGINAGVVGFLTEVHIDNALASLERILNDDYTIDKRIRLKTGLSQRELEPAVNEVVIHTDEIAKMRLYLIQVDGIQAQTVRADGIIIATPTGSTSYAMSAGGPILDPNVDAFLVVPIAPFKLTARPLVVPGSATITVKLLDAKRNSVLVIDGQAEYRLDPNDMVTFSKASVHAEFIRFDPNFYKLIEEKLTSQ